jgi:F0F1-type ATP synthase alpha subunit
MPLERKAPGVIFSSTSNEPLQTGIKAVDIHTRWSTIGYW